MRARGDTSTLDIFDWNPPELVERFSEEKVRAASLRSRISRAIAEVLREQADSREDIAARMGAWLGEDMPKSMLDAYASEAREDHTPTFLRLLALIHVTQDFRLLQLGAELFGRSVVENKYLPWVEVGQMADKKEEYDRAFDAAKRAARRGMRT